MLVLQALLWPCLQRVLIVLGRRPPIEANRCLPLFVRVRVLAALLWQPPGRRTANEEIALSAHRHLRSHGNAAYLSRV